MREREKKRKKKRVCGILIENNFYLLENISINCNFGLSVCMCVYTEYN